MDMEYMVMQHSKIEIILLPKTSFPIYFEGY